MRDPIEAAEYFRRVARYLRIIPRYRAQLLAISDRVLSFVLLPFVAHALRARIEDPSIHTHTHICNARGLRDSCSSYCVLWVRCTPSSSGRPLYFISGRVWHRDRFACVNRARSSKNAGRVHRRGVTRGPCSIGGIIMLISVNPPRDDSTAAADRAWTFCVISNFNGEEDGPLPFHLARVCLVRGYFSRRLRSTAYEVSLDKFRTSFVKMC